MAEEKTPVHTSIYARQSIVGTNAILYGTHLTTGLDISTLSTISYRGYSNIVPLSKKLSIVFSRRPRHAMELRGHKTLKSTMIDGGGHCHYPT